MQEKMTRSFIIYPGVPHTLFLREDKIPQFFFKSDQEPNPAFLPNPKFNLSSNPDLNANPYTKCLPLP